MDESEEEGLREKDVEAMEETRLYGGRRDLEIWKRFQEIGIRVSRNLETKLSGLWRLWRMTLHRGDYGGWSVFASALIFISLGQNNTFCVCLDANFFK